MPQLNSAIIITTSRARFSYNDLAGYIKEMPYTGKHSYTVLLYWSGEGKVKVWGSDADSPDDALTEALNMYYDMGYNHPDKIIVEC